MATHEHEVPVPAWVTVRIDGDQVSRVTAEAGETVTIDLERRDTDGSSGQTED